MYTRSMAIYDALYSFKDYAREADILNAVIAAHCAGNSLLDVACGTGKHLEILQQGRRAMGLDINAELLAIARERCPAVTFVQGDMSDFDLGQQFDVVTCLFSAIGAMITVARLNAAVAAMARHVAPGGVLIVEPWFTPEQWHPGHPHMTVVDEPDLKIARLTVSEQAGCISRNAMHYTIATPAGVEYFVETLEMGLFTPDEYQAAFAATGLDVEFDPEGLIGRGLYIGRRG